MIVCREHKFVYMAPKKTGSTSMRAMLDDNFTTEVWRRYESPDIRTTELRPDWRSSGPDWKHVCDLPQQFADYFVFATVRNPFRIEASRYKHDVKHGYTTDTFEKFISRLTSVAEPPSLYRKLKQHPDYKPPSGCVGFDLNAVVKVDSAASANQQLAKLPFYRPGLRIQHLNKSGLSEPIYSKDTARIVAEVYREDFEMFGYDPESWKTVYLIPMV